ncbi:hypothetical protein H6G97_32335 [Nostoc flagelliforme FACHB-838]|uniref:Uncharacterized protein n=2 Tax=Nostoc flagelliforme TaxID=1306274 RepID=A0ABR8DYM2_9NOSO|nr:hypothetical protein [Nostoc flagelliforme FACHB-838]
MTSDNFISARISANLLKRVQEYTQVTGETKTDILIKALTAYLDSYKAIKDNSNSLEKKVDELEKTCKALSNHKNDSMRERHHKNDLACAKALKELASYLTPALLPEALETACAIEDELARAKAVKALVNHLPQELLPSALETTRDIEDDFARAKAMMALASKFPKLLPEALQIARNIKDGSNRAIILSELTAHLPEVLDEALEAVRNINKAKYGVITQ